MILKKIFFLCVLIFFACKKEISYNGSDELIPVCNAFISQDQVLKIHLSYSANIIGTVVTLDGAEIKVYENGHLRIIDFIEDNGYYISNFYPENGNFYYIEVWKDNKKLVTAYDTIPYSTAIEKPEWRFPVGMIDEWTMAGLVSFRFTDDSKSKNYYEIMIAKYNNDVLDHNYIIEINNEFISLNTDRSWLDIRSILFSDSLIQGKTVNVEIKTQGSERQPPVVILRNVSYNYYRYRQRLPVHQFLQGKERDIDLSFFRGEPIDMFTNIDGGLGVFVAYNQDIKECLVIQ